MLPSKFERTDLINRMDLDNMHQTQTIDDQRSQQSMVPGPAQYDNMEHIIGQKKITTSGIKVQPQYSFSKSLTHRTSSSRAQSNQKSRQFSEHNGYVVEQARTAINKYGYDGQSNMMIFNMAQDHQNPGVGDYSIAQTLLNLTKQTPKATIGNQSRFLKKCSLNEFVPNIPEQYELEAKKAHRIPPKLGTFNSEKRWTGPGAKNPGVGDYDITKFKCFS